MKRLNQLRIDAGLSIADIAGAAGVDNDTACGWLSGRSLPDEKQQAMLASLFGVHASDLDEPEINEPPRKIDRIIHRLSTTTFRSTA